VAASNVYQLGGENQMYCTKCGTEARENDKFCCECGAATGRDPREIRVDRLTRSVQDSKIAGVCAGFARYMNVDVTLVRILWLVLMVWPLPLFGIVSYIVAWIVMPKDPVTVIQRSPVTS
jgi:phage shock protein C